MPHVPPDFLSTLLALARFMRLSLLKAAHAVLRWSHVQEIRVASAYVGRIRRAKPTRAFAIRSAKAVETYHFGPGIRISCTGRHQQPRVRLSLRKAA